jgi:hypothetical protein
MYYSALGWVTSDSFAAGELRFRFLPPFEEATEFPNMASKFLL